MRGGSGVGSGQNEPYPGAIQGWIACGEAGLWQELRLLELLGQVPFEYEIQTVQSIIPLDSNGIESARNHVTATPAAIRLQLEYLGRLDSAEAIAATMSDKAKTMWEYAEDFLSGDSTGASLRAGLGFGDSAWAQMILDADSNFGKFDAEQAQ